MSSLRAYDFMAKSSFSGDVSLRRAPQHTVLSQSRVITHAKDKHKIRLPNARHGPLAGRRRVGHVQNDAMALLLIGQPASNLERTEG
jgi:hypothetical protein